MNGLPYIVFLIRAAGYVGKAHAQALARMLREQGDMVSAERVEYAFVTPFTEAEKTEMLKANGVEPT